MLNEKMKASGPLLMIMGFITLMYIPAAYFLLRAYDANIQFTQKELRGLEQYEQLITQYFSLHEQATVDRAETTRLRNAIRAVGDESNLILDPQIHSYYAMDILFQHIPLMVEHVEMYRLDALSLRDAPHHLERLEYSINKVLAIDTAQHTAIQENFQDIKVHFHNLKHINDESKNYVIKHIVQLKNATAELLEQLLRTREAEQKHQYYMVLTILLAVYVVLMTLILIAARNYADKREVKLARERQALIIKLEEKNEELEKFSYAAAHDLKEPVRTMRSFAMLLAEESAQALDASARNYVDILKNTAARAEQMINDLLGYSTISHTSIELEPCDAREEIDAVLQDLQLRIVQTQAQITVGDMPQISTVPSMFRRVMLNLIDNAIKYSKENTSPEIHISALRVAEGWQFCVADNGIGIAPEHLASVFEPFRRLKAKKNEGNGIGLTICKKIIERLGGRIWMESPPTNTTEVYFIIPA